MAIDPNIALQYRGVELPNQLAQYGALAFVAYVLTLPLWS